MRIAQVAPLIESVPPMLYGGTERVVSHLVEELVRQGHDVTLFASGDSRSSARLVPVCPQALRLSGTCQDFVAPHVLTLEQVLRRADEFDVVHFHVAPLHFPVARRCLPAHVTTLHGRLDLPELAPLYQEFTDIPCVSISDAQRVPLPRANWRATIHHGLPPASFPFQPRRGSYLAFLGRISPEKRADRAIAIARACGQRLRIAAKVDPADAGYFAREIRPLLDHPLIEFIGEISDREKGAFLGNASALLFPIDWPEPFGLVMIEALACGTPVVAFRGGSVAEVLEDGVTGFVVGSVGEAIDAVHRIGTLDRRRCRIAFERRFTVARMAAQYVEVYKGVMAGEPPLAGLTEPPCSTSYA
ncbi:MAG: glycosyltransferase family 4 protein [Vicinamibacterales bacterium]